MTLKKNQHFRVRFWGGGGGHQKAYAVYAFINVDNCERPLKKARKRKNTMWEKFKQSKLTCDRLIFDQANKEYNKAMVEAQIKHEKTMAESLKKTPSDYIII